MKYKVIIINIKFRLLGHNAYNGIYVLVNKKQIMLIICTFDMFKKF